MKENYIIRDIKLNKLMDTYDLDHLLPESVIVLDFFDDLFNGLDEEVVEDHSFPNENVLIVYKKGDVPYLTINKYKDESLGLYTRILENVDNFLILNDIIRDGNTYGIFQGIESIGG